MHPHMYAAPYPTQHDMVSSEFCQVGEFYPSNHQLNDHSKDSRATLARGGWKTVWYAISQRQKFSS